MYARKHPGREAVATSLSMIVADKAGMIISASAGLIAAFAPFGGIFS
jgi:hypothetical protein